MSGLESIATCKMHRNKAELLFAQFDENYIQKWVLHDEAVDLMVLKVQKFAMEDHYARLYGPRVIARDAVTKTIRPRSPSDFNRESLNECKINFEENSEDPVGNKESKKILANAFAAHPFSKYQRCDRVKMDSNEDLQNMLEDAEKKSSLIWKKAFSKARQERVIGKPTEEKNLDGKSDIRKNVDIATIVKLYRESKQEKSTE